MLLFKYILPTDIKFQLSWDRATLHFQINLSALPINSTQQVLWHEIWQVFFFVCFAGNRSRRRSSWYCMSVRSALNSLWLLKVLINWTCKNLGIYCTSAGNSANRSWRISLANKKRKQGWCEFTMHCPVDSSDASLLDREFCTLVSQTHTFNREQHCAVSSNVSDRGCGVCAPFHTAIFPQWGDHFMCQHCSCLCICLKVMSTC